MTIDSTNSPVAEGETVQVTATLENTGDSAAEQTVVLTIDGTQEDSTTVSLNSGESTQQTFSWSTSSGDAGDYTAAVASDNDSAATGVSVRKPPTVDDFTVTDQSNCPLIGEESVSFDVSWSTSNANSVTVSWDGSGQTESGTSGSATFDDPDGECNTDYQFDIVAENEVGSDSDSTTVTASGG